MKTGTFEGTYKNLEALVKRLEALGNLGFQILKIEGLAGRTLSGDRVTFHIEGTKFICPMNFNNGYETYNADCSFGVSPNSEGQDTDEWFDFNTALAANFLINKNVKNIIFHKLTIRNYLVGASPMIKLWVFQDPFFINQVNRMLRDMTP